jgi:hypothetical protein
MAQARRRRGGVSRQYAGRGERLSSSDEAARSDWLRVSSGQFRGGNRLVDAFHARGFTFLRPDRTDFNALSQNLVVNMLRKFNAN